MKLLALSTAEQCCSLAVSDGDILVYEANWDSRLTHSKRALNMIEEALEKRVGFPLEDIDGFIAAKGPGSFTGLRIGISIIRALAYSIGKEAHGISSLDGIGYRFSWSKRPVCVMMDAKRKEVYTSVYQFKDGQVVSKNKEQVLPPEKAIQLAGENALFAGSGALFYRKLIASIVKEFTLCETFLSSISASSMIRAAQNKDGFFENPENILLPAYIRKSDAEMQFIEKKGKY